LNSTYVAEREINTLLAAI